MMFEDEHFDDLSSNFVLTIFCYFQTKSSSIGIEILEMLQSLQQKHPQDSQLNINIVYTRDGG